MKNLLTRTLTGILFIVIITTAVLSGAYTFLFIFGIISLLGYIEFINLTQFGRKFDKILLMLDMAGACALFLAVFSFSGQLPYNFQKASILTYVIYLIARPVTQLYSTPEKSPITSWAYSILGQIRSLGIQKRLSTIHEYRIFADGSFCIRMDKRYRRIYRRLYVR